MAMTAAPSGSFPAVRKGEGDWPSLMPVYTGLLENYMLLPAPPKTPVLPVLSELS